MYLYIIVAVHAIECSHNCSYNRDSIVYSFHSRNGSEQQSKYKVGRTWIKEPRDSKIGNVPREIQCTCECTLSRNTKSIQRCSVCYEYFNESLQHKVRLLYILRSGLSFRGHSQKVLVQVDFTAEIQSDKSPLTWKIHREIKSKKSTRWLEHDR